MSKTLVFTGERNDFLGHQCTKKVFKDGLCKMHQPEAVQARAAKLKANLNAPSAKALAEFHARHFEKMESALRRVSSKYPAKGDFNCPECSPKTAPLENSLCAIHDARELLADIAADRSKLK